MTEKSKIAPFRVPFLWIAVLSGCSAGGAAFPPVGGSSSPSSQGIPGAAGGGSSGLVSGDPGTGSLGSTTPVTIGTGGDACAADSHAAESLPLDMFFMMDQSGSMMDPVSGGNKWSVVTAALSTFVQSQNTAGLSAGIQYFGIAGAGTAMGTACVSPFYCPPAGGYGAGNWNSSCTVSDYANPDVEIAPLPANGSAIASSLSKHGPSSDTPTLPALEGAIQHATAWGNAHPGHPTIVVLATDGDPNGCNSTAQNVAQAAAAGLAQNPKIMTFVIGVGSSLTSLNGIAQAGGTNQAFIVDTGQDVNAEFLDALNKIRGSAVLPCEYKIPAPTDGSSTLDLGKVNVAYTPGTGPDTGKVTNLLQVSSAAQCDANGGGWYYDDPTTPQKIELCPQTCTPVSNDLKGLVNVLVGCQTERAPVR